MLNFFFSTLYIAEQYLLEFNYNFEIIIHFNDKTLEEELHFSRQSRIISFLL